MDPRLKAALVRMGLKADATDDEAKTFMAERGLMGMQIVDPPATPTRSADPTAERDRVLQILELGSKHNMADEARAAVNDGISVPDFKCQVLERMGAQPAGTATLGMSDKEARSFSFCRLINAMSTGDWRKAGFEREVCDETAKLHHDRKFRGIAIPMDVMSLRINLSNSESAKTRELAERAGLVVGTPTAGGNLVATVLQSGSFIDLLRVAMIMNQMGMTILDGLVGDIAIPRQTGGASYYFLGENDDTTESAATFDQVGLTPKTVAARTAYSRKLLLQSSISIEQFVRMDLAMKIAEGIQYGCLNGSGSNNQPTGLFNLDINSVAIGDNGGAIGWPHIVNMETEVAVDNVFGSMAYLTNAKVRGVLKQTQQFYGTNGAAIWGNMVGQPGMGEMNGYPAFVTNAVPSNATKGTGTALSKMVFGKWSDAILGLWGVLDMIADPFSQSAKGQIYVTGFQSFDFDVRHLESFCKVVDINTTTVYVS